MPIEKQFIERWLYVPKAGDKIIDPRYYDYATDAYYVVVERDVPLAEPKGDVYTRCFYTKHLGATDKILVRKSSISGIWSTPTNADGYTRTFYSWTELVDYYGITGIDKTYRVEED